jgi:hypothetical protein
MAATSAREAVQLYFEPLYRIAERFPLWNRLRKWTYQAERARLRQVVKSEWKLLRELQRLGDVEWKASVLEFRALQLRHNMRVELLMCSEALHEELEGLRERELETKEELDVERLRERAQVLKLGLERLQGLEQLSKRLEQTVDSGVRSAEREREPDATRKLRG